MVVVGPAIVSEIKPVPRLAFLHRDSGNAQGVMWWLGSSWRKHGELDLECTLPESNTPIPVWGCKCSLWFCWPRSQKSTMFSPPNQQSVCVSVGDHLSVIGQPQAISKRKSIFHQLQELYQHNVKQGFGGWLVSGSYISHAAWASFQSPLSFSFLMWQMGKNNSEK